MPVGIVAALPSETAMFARLRAGSHTTLSGGHQLALSGIGATRAKATARKLVADGAETLISWGSAAGLEPSLPAGTLVLPSTLVAADGERFQTDADWRRHLASAMSTDCQVARDTLMAEAPSILATTDDKAALARNTAASAADMESAAIARVAAEHGLAMLTIRAIADDACTTLPASARASVAADGHLALRQLLRCLLAARRELHTELRGLKQAATGFRSAQRALGHARPALLAAADAADQAS
ncbi:phosphorylase family protein [Salinisphaera orenii]|uniref:phosphorylase family protein n=1 Tax=Salinisphaera orenii TaxID=856731 RepID=UPI000DBEA5E9